MKRINTLLTLSSLDILLVTLERFSFTTKVLLQPDNFLRLHEIIQITFLILFTVIIPAFLFKELSHNFAILKTKKGQWIALIFILGVYFYATGNGLHEVSGFLLYQYCNIKHIVTAPCKSMYFNDFYTGNIYYFIGAMLMNFSLILLEISKPVTEGTGKEYIVLIINSLIYSVAIVDYAAIDPVPVGLFFSIITMVLVDGILIWRRAGFKKMPFTFYCGLAYTIGSILSVIVRFTMVFPH